MYALLFLPTVGDMESAGIEYVVERSWRRVHLSSEGKVEPLVMTGSYLSFYIVEVYNVYTRGDQIFVLTDLL